MVTQTYFTKDEAAEYLRCSRRTIDYLVSRNELQAYRVVKKLLFTRDDLDKLVQKRRAKIDLDKIVNETMRELGVGK